MTKLHLTFWRQEHTVDERRPGVVNILFKPFSDRIAGYVLIEAKNESELKAEIARHLEPIKTALAELAVQEYGPDGYVKPSLSVLKYHVAPNRKFANFDAVARKVCDDLSFNAAIHLSNVKDKAEFIDKTLAKFNAESGEEPGSPSERLTEKPFNDLGEVV